MVLRVLQCFYKCFIRDLCLVATRVIISAPPDTPYFSLLQTENAFSELLDLCWIHPALDLLSVASNPILVDTFDSCGKGLLFQRALSNNKLHLFVFT